MSRHPLIEPRRGEGKRWETTMYTATKEVEDALKEEPQVRDPPMKFDTLALL